MPKRENNNYISDGWYIWCIFHESISQTKKEHKDIKEGGQTDRQTDNELYFEI